MGAYELRPGHCIADMIAALQDAGRLEQIKFQDNRYLVVKVTGVTHDVRFDFGTGNNTTGIVHMGTWSSGTSVVGMQQVTNGATFTTAHVFITEKSILVAGNMASPRAWFMGKTTSGLTVFMAWIQISTLATRSNYLNVMFRGDGTTIDFDCFVPVREARTLDFKYLAADISIFEQNGMIITDGNGGVSKIAELKALTRGTDPNRGYTIVDHRQVVVEGGSNAALANAFPLSFVFDYAE